jgi:TolA-binding protein
MKSLTRWFVSSIALSALIGMAAPPPAVAQRSQASAAAQSAAVATSAAFGAGGAVSAEYERQSDSLYRAAQNAMNDGDYRRAAALFAQVVERYPRSSVAPQALYYRGLSLFRVGGSESLTTARETVESMIERFPAEARRMDAGALRMRICGELAQRGDARCAQEVARAAQSGGQGTGQGAGQGATAQQGESCPGENDDSDVRIMALNSLLQMNADQAVPLLERVLSRRDACSVGMRRKAVFILSQKRTDRTADLLLRVAREDPSAEVREQAIFWLGNTRDPRVVDILADIVRNSNDPAAQEKAIFALSQTRSERAYEFLRDIAGNARASDRVREQAIFWLGQNRNASTSAFLRELYGRETDEGIKDKIIFQLSQRRDAESQQWLLGIAMNERESPQMRKQALFWAGQQRAVSGSDLGSIYDRVSDREMKEQVIFVLSQRNDSTAIDKLMDIVRRDPDSKLRSNAMFWLGQKRDPRVIRFLEEIINK